MSQNGSDFIIPDGELKLYPPIKSVEFKIVAEFLEDGSGKVSIQDAYKDKEGIDAPFDFWMIACEYFLHKTCQKSNAGYEKAQELLCKGAMEYKNN